MFVSINFGLIVVCLLYYILLQINLSINVFNNIQQYLIKKFLPPSFLRLQNKEENTVLRKLLILREKIGKKLKSPNMTWIIFCLMKHNYNSIVKISIPIWSMMKTINHLESLADQFVFYFKISRWFTINYFLSLLLARLIVGL